MTDITNVDSEGHAYYVTKDQLHGYRSYRLTIETPDSVTPVDEPRPGVSVSCASPCSRSALVQVRADRDIEHAEVTVHNVAGRRVATLLSGRVAAGTTPIRWDTAGSSATALPSGVYFVRLRADSETARSMFVLVR